MVLRLDPSLVSALAGGSTLLTPSQRAARAISRAWDEEQRAAGHTLWAPALVLPLPQWLAARWQEQILRGADGRVLLNATQQHALWCEILSGDGEIPPLRSPNALADLAERAWSLLCLHDGGSHLRDAKLSTDTRAFERWSLSFQRRLQREQFITPAELPSALTLSGPANLILVDFDIHPPAVQRLFDRLRNSGSQVEELRTGAPQNLGHSYTAPDDPAELAAVAAWVKQWRADTPDARIAIVVPNLEDRRAQIERVFAPMLDPARTLITSRDSSSVYEFSLGKKLADLPIATTALDLLAWPLEPLPVERISALLLSPWFTGGLAAAAAFDAFELRHAKLLQPELSLDATILLVDGSCTRSALSDLLQRMRSLRKTARDSQVGPGNPDELSHTEWAENFRSALASAGWTSHATRDSLAFQQHRSFESALDELATLDFDGRRIGYSAALQALRRILGQTIFAPESQDAPVQILGPLEVGGVSFDALWFLGADDLAWPPSTASSPLLPWQLQRALGMPGADRTRDDKAAQALTQRIAQAARQVVFSYALRNEEGERRPSPLLAELSLIPLAVPRDEDLDPLPFEEVMDNIALPLLPDRPVPGGAQVLQLQAACGFRAFAEKRLFSNPLEAREPGLNALERGNVVHNVMQTFWTGLKTHKALLALPPADRFELLDDAIEAAVDHAHPSPQTSWDAAYLQVQRQRLRDVLEPWIAFELSRAPFEVQPLEQKKSFQLGPLQFSLRIDRIDVTPSKGLIILDYKTGAAAPSHWQGDRPDAPQLPLYAVLTQSEGARVDAVAFALLRAGKDLGLKGCTDDSTILEKPTPMQAPSLAEQIEQWREVLTHLAVAFAEGDTRVLPKLYPKTCKHCDQRILCRLNVASLEEQDDEDHESQGEPVHG